MEEPKLTDEEKRQLKLIAELASNEAFVVWKEKFCLPVLQQLRQKLKNPKELSDIELRASVMHLNSMEDLFENIFDQARFLTTED